MKKVLVVMAADANLVLMLQSVVTPAGAPIPEPCGLGLIGIALLTLRRRREWDWPLSAVF